MTEAPFAGRGMWIFGAHIGTVAALATLDYDWICLDGQHGEFDRSTLHAGVMAARGRNVIVRVASRDAATIGFALDAGASAVIVPMVNSAEQAAAAAAACYYPPIGNRSWGPIAPLWGLVSSTAAEVNSRARCAVMIETADALAQVEQIAAVPGVDMLFVGPFDLSVALGITVEELLSDDSPESPLARVVAAAQQAGIALGAFGGSVERAAILRGFGFTAVSVDTDLHALLRGAGEAIEADGLIGY